MGKPSTSCVFPSEAPSERPGNSGRCPRHARFPPAPASVLGKGTCHLPRVAVKFIVCKQRSLSREELSWHMRASIRYRKQDRQGQGLRPGLRLIPRPAQLPGPCPVLRPLESRSRRHPRSPGRSRCRCFIPCPAFSSRCCTWSFCSVPPVLFPSGMTGCPARSSAPSPLRPPPR